MKNDISIKDLEGIDNERELLARAYMWQGLIKSRQITPELYAEAMAILDKKLGFEITDETLKDASAKYV